MLLKAVLLMSVLLPVSGSANDEKTGFSQQQCSESYRGTRC